MRRRRSRLRMRWNDSPSEAREFQAGDAQFELIGTLAPFLLAWSGEAREDGSWRVVVRPKGTKLAAPFELKFPERPLPLRPDRRE